jgi:hypothetical protein
MGEANGQEQTTERVTVDRDQVEQWIDKGVRVFVVFLTSYGARVAATGLVRKFDGELLVLEAERSRATVARVDRIVMLKVAGSAS